MKVSLLSSAAKRSEPAMPPFRDATEDGPLADAQGRTIAYLRLSLTKGCSMRCTYCRPAFYDAPHDEPVLSPGEIEQLVRHLAARYGLNKVRLTGGDPTARPDLLEIIERLARGPAVAELAMSTNGLTLAKKAAEYRQAGLHRVNVSLDSLDPARFAAITGVDGLPRVLAGIDAAAAAGLRVKLNTVVLRKENDEELPALLAFAAERGLEIRFIELMPMGPLAAQWSQRYVSVAEMRRRLSPRVTHWHPLPRTSASARREEVMLEDRRTAIVGFITPMSNHFCDRCDRIRIAADGTLYPCLMDEAGPALLPALRPRLDERELDRLLRAGLRGKAAVHPHDAPAVMTSIGG